MDLSGVADRARSRRCGPTVLRQLSALSMNSGVELENWTHVNRRSQEASDIRIGAHLKNH